MRGLLRYGVVGGGLVLVEYALYLAIVRAVPNAAVPAYLASRSVAGVLGFAGHARFSFGGAALSARNGMRYALSVAANMAFAALLLMATVPLIGALAAKLASDCVVILASYVVGRRFVFSHAPEGAIR